MRSGGRSRCGQGLAALAAGLIAAAPGVSAAAADLRGARLYQERCAGCHESPRERTPSRQAISGLAHEAVLTSMTTGTMKAQAADLDAASIASIAAYLGGSTDGAPLERGAVGRCADEAGPVDLSGPAWNGWGRDLHNSRFQPEPGLAAQDVPRLKLKWAFGYQGTVTYGQPTIVGNRVFVSTTSRQVHSLNARSGCTYWTFVAEAGVRTAVTVGVQASSARRQAVYLGDERAFVYALDAQSGALLWKVHLDPHPYARITGAPVLHGGRLYVPVASAEEVTSRSVMYECCTFRGALAALDAESGRIIWKTHTIGAEPAPYRTKAHGLNMLGPAGGAIRSAPTIDARRGRVYVGTGNSYTDVPTTTTDAVLGFALSTGELAWARQATRNDNFLVGCLAPQLPRMPPLVNCPDPVGPDFDFGASPILRTLADGRDIIVAGQKSGMVYGLDPDKDGEIVWQTRVGEGGALGGVQWGPAADEGTVYVAVADLRFAPAGSAGSLTALSLDTGDRRWHWAAPAGACSWGEQGCSNALSAAVTAIPGVVLAGSLDGHLRAFATADGAIIWSVDTARSYDTINGVRANGGSLDTGGATLASGMLYVNSGYGRFVGRSGNVLLAFSIEGQ